MMKRRLVLLNTTGTTTLVPFQTVQPAKETKRDGFQFFSEVKSKMNKKASKHLSDISRKPGVLSMAINLDDQGW